MILLLILLGINTLQAAKPSSKYAVATPKISADLLKRYPNLETEPNEQIDDATALQYAINELSLADVQAVLLLPDIDVNFPTDYPPLRLAIEVGNVDKLNALLTAKANPNTIDENNETPLVHAARSDKNADALVKALVDAGASVPLALTKTKSSSVQQKLRAYLKPQAAAAKK